MIKQFRHKLKKERRSLKWFYDNYMQNSEIAYITVYHQITGYIKNISKELTTAIQTYLAKE